MAIAGLVPDRVCLAYCHLVCPAENILRRDVIMLRLFTWTPYIETGIQGRGLHQCQSFPPHVHPAQTHRSRIRKRSLQIRLEPAPIVGSEPHHGGDSDLESTLGIIDRVFGNFRPMYWQGFSLTIPHHSWMGHVLLYRAWDLLRRNEPLPDDIKEFVLRFLRLGPPPSTPIVADCLFIIGLVLKIELHVDDLFVIDKR
ncbi:hypothetical protein BDM02DRAFT_3116874 [Thelephora ganbajun]|uniref:Uncharacterized protein n=1 Tax=Thelephora ganbajun TaxID=370292 RepID=A0ACB6ZD70_THEGA|nr:hypothetical protein BDM02DRAFT_3116874 [Thelephora ganbajun]